MGWYQWFVGVLEGELGSGVMLSLLHSLSNDPCKKSSQSVLLSRQQEDFNSVLAGRSRLIQLKTLTMQTSYWRMKKITIYCQRPVLA